MATWKVTTKEIDGKKVRGIVLPAVDRDELDFIPTAAYGSKPVLNDEGIVVDVEIPEERFFPFQPAGSRIAHKRLFTVKAHAPNGAVVQIPMEDQINNHTQSPSTGLGLAPYVKKGFIVFWDPADGATAFCAARDCFAEARKDSNFCNEQHRTLTKPEGNQTGFGQGATTSRTWG